MKRIPWLFSGLGLVLLLAACGPAVSPTPMPPRVPAEIAGQSGQQMLTIDTLHFVIEISGRLTYVDNTRTLALKRAEGDLIRPDKVRTIVRLVSLGLTTEIGIIELGREQYVTNPINQQWEKMPAGYGWYLEPRLFFDPERGIEAVLRETDWTFNAAEEARSAGFHVLQGRVSGDRLWAITFGMITSGDVAVDFWVSQQDGYVQRIRLVELESDPEDPTTWIIELSAFDRPVEITAPPLP